MSDLPTPVRSRTTPGSKRVAEFTERNNVRPVSWYVVPELHAALTSIAKREDLSLQLLITHACETRYADPNSPALPPLVPPTKLKIDPHKNVTWYCPVELFMSIKMIGLKLQASAQQLITSAVVDQYKGRPEVRALRINTGVAPYMRAPTLGEVSFQRAPLRKAAE